MGLSGFQGIGFRIPLRGFFSFRVTPGLVVPAGLLEAKRREILIGCRIITIYSLSQNNFVQLCEEIFPG